MLNAKDRYANYCKFLHSDPLVESLSDPVQAQTVTSLAKILLAEYPCGPFVADRRDGTGVWMCFSFVYLDRSQPMRSWTHRCCFETRARVVGCRPFGLKQKTQHASTKDQRSMLHYHKCYPWYDIGSQKPQG